MIAFRRLVRNILLSGMTAFLSTACCCARHAEQRHAEISNAVSHIDTDAVLKSSKNNKLSIEDRIKAKGILGDRFDGAADFLRQADLRVLRRFPADSGSKCADSMYIEVLAFYYWVALAGPASENWSSKEEYSLALNEYCDKVTKGFCSSEGVSEEQLYEAMGLVEKYFWHLRRQFPDVEMLEPPKLSERMRTPKSFEIFE